MATRVYIEAGAKKAFASAADWPGWSRGGRDAEGALEALAAYAPRYAPVAKIAKVDFPKDPTKFTVVERQKGNATTDFGVPGMPAEDESKPLTAKQRERLAALVEACWTYLDHVRARAPASLRKGPRGGGRDRDKMYEHVLESEMGYARQIGLRLKEPDRDVLREAFRHPATDTRWPLAYAMRRIAWHSLDHAWEMEDRIP